MEPVLRKLYNSKIIMHIRGVRKLAHGSEYFQTILWQHNNITTKHTRTTAFCILSVSFAVRL
jgi:hypothetical protein